MDWSSMRDFDNIGTKPIADINAKPKQSNNSTADAPAKSTPKTQKNSGWLPTENNQNKGKVKDEKIDSYEAPQPDLYCADWKDMKRYDDDHDGEWFEAEEKRLCELYGGPFIRVKYITQGHIGYLCELCTAETNAKKILESHCQGMKHLKKKNLWELNNKIKTEGTPEVGSMSLEAHLLKRTKGKKNKVNPNSNYTPLGSRTSERGPSSWDPGHQVREVKKKRPISQLDHVPRLFDIQTDDFGSRGRREAPSAPPFHSRQSESPPPPRRRQESHSQRRGDSPPAKRPSFPLVKNLAKSPAGVMLEKLSNCCVKNDEDADLALNVVVALTKALKEYNERRGEKKLSELFLAAEIKLNTVRALESGLKLLGKTPNTAHKQTPRELLLKNKF